MSEAAIKFLQPAPEYTPELTLESINATGVVITIDGRGPAVFQLAYLDKANNLQWDANEYTMSAFSGSVVALGARFKQGHPTAIPRVCASLVFSGGARFEDIANFISLFTPTGAVRPI